MKVSIPNLLRRFAVMASVPVLLGLGGCSLSPTVGNPEISNVPAFSGILHGGPNPIVGARVVLYATTSGGYGSAATVLQEATQQGASAHQDTDSGGFFSFAGGFTCPAGQYVYVVSYGGNTGANANNPNSVLMTALGSCGSLYTGTTYNGPSLWIDELTTVAAGYALGNFMNVAGDAVNGYTVNIGAPATNNAGVQPTGSATASNTLTTGCVSNSYYDPAKCLTTSAPGLRDAIATAVSLVNTNTGVPNATNGNGGIVPVQLMNTLGNVLQACVNSTGGGTNTTTGAPSTTVSTANGTVTDGTPCGNLFAYTSYTNTGLQSGTLTVAGNTLDAIKNLAHRPSGNTNGTSTTNGTNAAPGYTAGCASGTNTTASAGTVTAPTCIFNLSSGIAFYNVKMSAAPPDWTLAITYPKGSFSTTANALACNTTTPATNALLYPTQLATDINDDILILNQDSGTGYCYNVISIANNGVPNGASAFDNAAITAPVWISTDAYGHAIIPAKNENAIKVYAAGISEIPSLAQTIAGNATVASATNGANALIAASLPYYTSVDMAGDIFVTAQNSTNDLGLATATTQSHSAPSYTGATAGSSVTTGKYYFAAADVTGNFFATSFGSGTSNSTTNSIYSTTGALIRQATALQGSNASGYESTQADNAGNLYTLLLGDAVTTPTSGYIVNKQTYTPATGSALSVSSQIYTFLPAPTSPLPGEIDGGNTIWWGDRVGSSTVASYIRSYETATGYGSPQLAGCRFQTAASTTCGATVSTTSAQVVDFIGVTGVAVDAAGNIWVASPYNNQLTEVIGTATPTWPLFMHNASSMKP